MRTKRITFGGFAALLLLVMAMAPSAQAIPVSAEISLVIDISGSISSADYLIQMDGYINAFNSVGIRNLLKAPGNETAFNVVMFSTSAAQKVGWSLLSNDAAIDSFVASLTTLRNNRPGDLGDLTDIAEGLSVGLNGLQTNNFEGVRRLIDISGDGKQNTGVAGCTTSSSLNTDADCLGLLSTQRTAAINAGITINGLPITLEYADLNTYFQSNVITPGGFTIVANTFPQFGTALNQKLEFEITGGVPEPGTYAMLGCGLLALGFARRYRKS